MPVAPAETIDELRPEVDDIVCLETPEPFIAIGIHYRDFHQLSDDDVVRVLATTATKSTTRAEKAPAPAGR